MRYTQHTDEEVSAALATIGVDSIDELFKTIPPSLRLNRPLKIPTGVSELETLADAQALASRNADCSKLACFLGGGAYDHFVPTVVDALAAQSEFLTAYTPYQAEASQGILQLFYEFQTMVCELTGMEVANASMYEVASATAEAVSMACSLTKRRQVLVAASIHPDTRATLQAYSHAQNIEVKTIPAPNGILDETALSNELNQETAAVVLQSPNFFGCLERLDKMIPAIHTQDALAIVATDPLASGILKSPGTFDADIVVAEGQALGIPMQYGGPYLGLLAGREKYLRKMPGRVVGVASDKNGRRGFCLVLQTREQHIKRERATSNICTNQGLLAIRASIYLAAMGRRGLAEVANQCFQKAHYAADRICELDGFALRFDAPFFKEFVVQTTHDVPKLRAACRQQGLLAGVPLGTFDLQLDDCLLLAVTEKRTKTEIDKLVKVFRSV